uniref:HD domain-containing protein n=1 Tax=Rhabditophanes sp. KR3021 TaxID=114890 RepID=A0AC35TW03_9BILA
MDELLCKKREICDPVHGFIEVSHSAGLLIDTKYFQRTNKLAALSVNKNVYPGAEHTRKIHMLGAYHIATLKLISLRKASPKEDISDKDILCVGIAALFHDIGHGPYSHTYEVFVKTINPESTFSHESATIEMIELIFKDYPAINDHFAKIFEEEDYLFIYECINPPKEFLIKDEWMLKGRPIEKSFLYDIVSNIHSGLDVDKFDYLLRDAQMAGIKDSPFNKDTLHRIINNCKVFMDPDRKYKRLAYDVKIQLEIEAVFHARMTLHRKLYVHKTCVGYEKRLLDAWVSADDHLSFKSTDEISYKLSTMHENIELYSKITDEVVMSAILMSDSAELEESRNILNELADRQLPKRIYLFESNNLKKDNYTSDLISKEIIENCEVPITQKDFFVNIREMHGGKKLDKDPVEFVLFYDKNDELLPKRSSSVKKQFAGGYIDASVYVNYHLSEEKRKAIKESAEKFSKKLQ